MNEEKSGSIWEALLASLGEDGRIILGLALKYAEGLGHYYVGAEHLFIAMAKLHESLIQKVLAAANLEAKETRDRIKRAAGPGYQEPPWKKVFLTPRLQNILMTAHEIASDENCTHIGERHLLLAILQDEDSLPSRILRAVGQEKQFTLAQLIKQAKEMPRSPPPQGHPPYDLPGQPDAKRFAQEFGDPQFFQQRPKAGNAPMLDKYGRDLNAEARAKKIHAAIGVDDLLRRMKRILIQRETNNPLLIGEAGVGKTAIVEGLAYELVHGKPGVPELAGKRIVEISINSLVAGTKYRGELEERIERILAEVKASPEATPVGVIVFIDEIHTVLGGGGDSVSNIANALKPALARGEFRCIGATTINEYRQYIEKDPALRRRFETIIVEEPNAKDCIEIINVLFNDHYGLNLSKSVIEAAVHLSARYIQDERLPAKAIKLLHQAEAYVKLPSFFGHDEKAEKEQTQPLFTAINENLIRHLLSKKTGIPLERLKGDELERIKGIEETLQAQAIGQDEAVHAVAQVIKRARAELRDPRRPVGVFLFVGPTGVGKTELARALAGFLFKDRTAMIRLDMSEYMEKHQVSRLIGAPPGYVGYEEEGQLTGQLRLHPYSVVLLDEIEKAHEDVHNIFLQLFDEGRLTDAKGRTVNGREAIFIMTSNVGSEIYAQEPVGFFSQEKLSPEWLKAKRDIVDKALHAKFKPEFLNRVDRVIHFNPLTSSDLTRIFHLQFESVKKRFLESRHINLTIKPEAIIQVCATGYDALNGARPLARAIDRLIVEPLTDLILNQEIKASDTIMINCNGLQLTFDKSQS